MSDDDQAVLPFDDGSTGRIIRKEWHEGRWFFSVVDVIAVLSDSPNPRNYWSMLKRKLEDEGAGELYRNCVQLKMRSPLDGKRYATDAADTETMLRIVQSIPSPKAEPIKQWLAREGARSLEETAAMLDEGQYRLLLRGEVATQNKSLAACAADGHGITLRDFGIFQDWGYKGLYDGERARDIAARKGLAKGQDILDHMGSTELATNLFRIVQTRDKLNQLAEEGVTSKTVANETHFGVGKAVRAAIEQIGGRMPEQLPTPAESIKELEQREQQRAQVRLQPPLFDGGTDSTM